jgi:glutathione peroxidase-family protein
VGTLNNRLKLKVVSLFLIWSGILALLSSCSGTAKNPENDFSGNGIKLCQKTLNAISEIKQIQNNKPYDEEFIKILNHPSPEFYAMKPGDSGQIQGISYLKIEKAFKSLEKAYAAYQLQLDSKISASSSNLSEKLYLSCNALDSIELNKILRDKIERIKKNVGTGKYRIEGSLFQITDIYSEVWNEAVQEFLKSQIDFQQEFENGIRTIPVEAFNEEKIKTMIDEPYSNNAALVNLYKLKMIKDNQQKMTELENELNNLSEAFNLMIQVQGELMKRKQNKQKIQEMNTSIEVLLSYE